MVTQDNTVWCRNCESQPALVDRLPAKESKHEILKSCWSCAQDLYGATAYDITRVLLVARDGKDA